MWFLYWKQIYSDSCHAILVWKGVCSPHALNSWFPWSSSRSNINVTYCYRISFWFSDVVVFWKEYDNCGYNFYSFFFLATGYLWGIYIVEYVREMSICCHYKSIGVKSGCQAMCKNLLATMMCVVWLTKALQFSNKKNLIREGEGHAMLRASVCFTLTMISLKSICFSWELEGKIGVDVDLCFMKTRLPRSMGIAIHGLKISFDKAWST